MAFDPNKLTVDFTSLSKIPASSRQQMMNQGLIPAEFMQQLTPTQMAKLFPKYFEQSAPDVSGFRSTGPSGETFDERAQRVSGGVPTATESPTGTSQPTVASQNQQQQQQQQQAQTLESILAPYGAQQTPGKKYKTNEKAGELQKHIVRVANNLGLNPKDLATLISYETAGSMNPYKKGPRTQWGQHRGLIQWGEVQAKKYGLDLNPNSPNRSSIEQQMNAVEQYFKDEGFVDWMNKNPNAPLVAVRRAMYATVNAGNPERVNASDAQNGGAPGTVIDKVNDMFRTKGTTHYNKAEQFLKDAFEEVETPTAEEFQAATAQLARKNVFKLNKQKLGVFAGMAESKIKEMLPEGVEYNPETGEISGDITMDQIVAAVKEKAPDYADQVSQYIEPVSVSDTSGSIISTAEAELQGQVTSTVVMSDDVKTFIADLPENAREEISRDPAKANKISAAIKAGAGDKVKQQITELYSRKENPTATEVNRLVTPGKGDPRDQWGLQEARDIKGVDPRLVHILEEASKDFPLRVRLFSGKEGRSKGVHSTGKASDIMIYDEAGNPIGAYGTPETANIYAMYAEKARQKQMELYPELNDKFVWGGSFSGMSKKSGVGGKYGGGDWMDFRIAGAVGTNEMKAYKFGEGWQKGYEYYASNDFLGIGAKQGQFTQEDYDKLSGLKLSEEQLARQRRIAERGGYNAGLLGHKAIGERQYPTQTVASSQQIQTEPVQDTSGNLIAGAGQTPTQEQATAQATATEAQPKEEKGMIQKAWDWVTGDDNTSEAPMAYGTDGEITVDQRNPARLIDSMGNESVIGEAGAEKVTIESKHNPQDQNQTLEQPMKNETKQLTDLSQQQPIIDWSKTSMGEHQMTSSIRDAFNYSKFSSGGWSKHLYLNGSKNVV